ncbi:SH3 domain and tetratricopeptide repeat-containing protein 1 isoform X1 [Acipenser oxyrinchus oxyrinchus]|uniref:SH3 domain and tetratricopeptide repeat-containing protein 1 isoform X1 n=1 Tax=Acipenser oxyrinchus oxyrinchus TaxID=40147 RepID=A0AAD8LUV3_ACIOX|nr:SH3 domain and tetratricopeptide repeat-containing protein 1 isoform X1 [Acipenser oxyrinchus oxyrinchus]
MLTMETKDSAKNGNFALHTIQEEKPSLVSVGTAKNGFSDRFLKGTECGTTLRQPFATQSGISTGAFDDNEPGRSRHKTKAKDIDESQKEGSFSCSAAEDIFPTAIFVKLVMMRLESGLPDTELQEMLRGKLRILENDSGEVMAVFSELSARLLSIHSDQDLIVITFKTFEEIWKFSTYHSLGFVGHCMENLLLDQAFWLQHLDEEDAWINVLIDEESLSSMYRGIMMQEGTYFARCIAEQSYDSSSSGSELTLQHNDIVIVEPLSSGSSWAAQSLVDGTRGVISKSVLEPVGSFHQWFLKTYTESIWMCSNSVQFDFPFQIAVGSCFASVYCKGNGPDELAFQTGDSIEIVGFLVSCLEWFVGKHADSGKIGLVKTRDVKPSDSACQSTEVFINEDEKSIFKFQEECFEEDSITLLKKMSQTDTGTVYKMDKLGPPGSARMLPQEMQSMVSDQERRELKDKRSISMEQREHQTSASLSEDEDAISIRGHPQPSGPGEPCFFISNLEENSSAEEFQPLLEFLNSLDYKPEFRNLYDFSFAFLNSTFHGYSEEEELVCYLGLARETARKKKMLWAQTRVCFLLGKLCAKKCKFSQARVYFEEALSVVKEDFMDMFLLIAVNTNLAAIYLKQKNKEKCSAIFERIAALLMGIPNYICSTEMESEILKYILKKTVLAQNKLAEARTCFLLAKFYTKRNENDRALPFIERLQLLTKELSIRSRTMPSDYYLTLGKLYGEKYLPHLAVSCVKHAALHSSSTLTDCLIGINFVLKNASRLYGMGRTGVVIPTQVGPYLKRALTFFSNKGEQAHCRTICLCLSQLYQHHKMFNKAICYLLNAINSESWTSSVDATDTQISLAWLHILNYQYEKALDILNSILDTSPSSCTPLQQGAVYNMRAIALRHVKDVKQAAESLQKALYICEEQDFKHNQAIVQANFGFLCVFAKATCVAETSLVKSVKLFSELQDAAHDVSFITVLLELGQYYIGQNQKEKGPFYYEWAFLIAIMANHADCQIQATQLLCHFYSAVSQNEAQCIIYSEHLLALARKTGDKKLEGEILESISQLYFSLGTERAYKSALEYTKRSLGIFIDLKKKEKEAYAWLQAGKIYHTLRQNELVDLYIQVAQDSAVSTGDHYFALELFEAAGDVFFNGSWDRDKAVLFYRDRALPLAIKTGALNIQLRLSNKLVELLLNLKAFGEAVEYAQTAMAISISFDDQLNERVAYHRLATVYHCLGQCELAEHYYLKALSLCSSPLEFDEETLYYVKVYQTLGDMLFYELKDPHDAAGYYHLALAAAMDLGNKKSQLTLCTRLATIYHNFLVNRELSLFFYQKARVFAADLNVRRINLSPDQYYQNTAKTHLKTFV